MSKPVAEMTVLEILDKNVDEKQLALDLFEKYAGGALKAKAEELKAKIASGEIDIIPGTTIDNALMVGAVDEVLKQLGLAQ